MSPLRHLVRVRSEFDDYEFGGSILDQLAALDTEENQEAQSFIGDELTLELKRNAQKNKEIHEAAVDTGRQAGHAPVLLYSAMEFLFSPRCKQEDRRYIGNYVDCTFGRGAYSREILARLSDSGRVYAFDVDPTAIRIGRELEKEDSRFRIFHRPYAELAQVLPDVPLNGVVLDIGISSPQVDEKARGFSLQNLAGADRPLDLRMNAEEGESAMEWLQHTCVEELAWVLRRYGGDYEESLLTERIAQAIMDDQELNGPYTSMRRFAEVVGRTRAFPDEEFEHPVLGIEHPAKLTVQAIRLFLNRELEQFRAVLPDALKLLVPGGRCLASSFKRKESAIVYKFLLEHEDPDPETIARISNGRRLRELYPLVGTDLDYSVKLIGKPIKASNFEVNKNRRARSGYLYVMEKAPRLSKQVRAKPRMERNRFREPLEPRLVGTVLE